MRTNLFKRTLALCLLLTMLLSVFGVTAFAEPLALPESTTWKDGELTVKLVAPNDIKNIKVKLIKLIEVNTAGITGGLFQPTDPEYVWLNNLGPWVEGVNPKYVEKAKTADDPPQYIYIPTQDFETPKNPKADPFYDQLEAKLETMGASWIEKGKDDLEENDDGTYQVTFTGLEMGLYLVAVNGDQSVYRPTVVAFDPAYDEQNDVFYLESPVQTVEMKGSPVKLSKVIENGKEDQQTTAPIDGETPIKYKVESVIPKYPESTIWTGKTYELKDRMTGQDLLPDTLQVLIAGKDCTDKLDITVNEMPLAEVKADPTLVEDKPVTEIVINLNGEENYKNFLVPGSKVVMQYQTKLNETAILKSDTFPGEEGILLTGNANTASLTYANDPYIQGGYKTLTDSTEVFTYGIRVTKVAEEDPTVTLQGAEFSLLDPNGKELTFKLIEGVYVKDDNGEDVLTSGNDGTISIKGLDVGTYQLQETKAPAGYSKNPTIYPIEIVDDLKLEKNEDDTYSIVDGMDGLPEETENEDEDLYVYYDDGMVPQTVKDTSTFALPETGGLGTVLYTVFGILLMAGGVLLIAVFVRRRKQ